VSHVDDIASDIETIFDDATVDFETGKNQSNRHGQRRRIIFSRGRGVLRFATGPGRALYTAGSPGNQTNEVFCREEIIHVELRAESDDALDIMFDRFVKAAWQAFGPNFLVDDNPYDWAGQDSSAGGSNTSRIPAIHIDIAVRLLSRDYLPLPAAPIEHTTTTVTELGTTQTVTVPTP
jgi:hypothetical protein